MEKEKFEKVEVKKKFEKPQMEVVKLKPAGMVCDSCPADCSYHECWELCLENY